jgi:CDP-paratose 2-epimerase
MTELRSTHSVSVTHAKNPIVVFGGAGFIGTNLASRLLEDGEDVVVFDNLSRPGVERNLTYLKQAFGRHLSVVLSDVGDLGAVEKVVTRAKAVFHLAAQVAVTSSLADPMHDFAVNAQGTLTILDAIRRVSPETPIVFASTNKVYGSLDDISVEDVGHHYLPIDRTTREFGIDETRRLDFSTPYGCSKGAADQYVLDYAHSFGLRTAVLRMSCIYGPHQCGTEDQGWVAHFVAAALRGEPITIYGDGKQVRDVLHVDDAVAAYRAVLRDIDRVSGQAFNLGGGPTNAVSLRTVLEEIADCTGSGPTYRREDWRTGDQLYFVADTRRLRDAVPWQPTIGWRDGLRSLAGWMSAQGIGTSTADGAKNRRTVHA